MRVAAVSLIDFRPPLEPHASACRGLVFNSERWEDERVCAVLPTNGSSLRSEEEQEVKGYRNEVADLGVLAIH